jgi:hypothetical protein
MASLEELAAQQIARRKAAAAKAAAQAAPAPTEAPTPTPTTPKATPTTTPAKAPKEPEKKAAPAKAPARPPVRTEQDLVDATRGLVRDTGIEKPSGWTPSARAAPKPEQRPRAGKADEGAFSKFWSPEQEAQRIADEADEKRERILAGTGGIVLPPKAPASALERAGEAFVTEGKLLGEATQTAKTLVPGLVKGADAVVKGTVAEGFERTLSDPLVVGAFAREDSEAGSAARAQARRMADAEDAKLATLVTEAREALVAKQDAARVEANKRDGADAVASRRLADSIMLEDSVRKGGENPAKMYLERRRAELLLRWGAQNVDDGEKVLQLEQRATETARKELVRLYTEGYTQFLADTTLGIDAPPSRVEQAGPLVKRLPAPMGAALGAAAVAADSRVGQALLPQRRVTEEGKVARAESIPGWVLSTLLGTTANAGLVTYDAYVKGEMPTLDAFAKSVDKREDYISRKIDGDEQVQADIVSGDRRRVVRALGVLAPYAALEMLTPDPLSAVSIVVKGAGMAADAMRVLARSQKIVDAVRIADKGARTAAAVDALKAVVKEIEASKKAAAEALRLNTGASAGRDLRTALEAADNDAPTAINLLDANYGEAGAPVATRLRDDIAARLSADPDVETFLRAVGATDRPLSAATGDAVVIADRLDAAQAAAVERGRAKFRERFAPAARAAVDDLLAQADDTARAAVRTQDVVPTALVDDAELDDLLGARDVRPAQAQRIADAKTPQELVAALERVPEAVRERVARRLGAQSFEDLRRLAKIDPAAVAEAAGKLGARVASEETALGRELDAVAALKAGPADVAAYAKARTAVVAAEKAARAADAEAALVANGTHPALKALGKASQDARKLIDDEPPFALPRAVQRDIEQAQRAQEMLDAATMTDAARAKRQADIDRRFRQYAQEVEVYRARYTEQLAASRAAREQALAAVRTARDAAATEVDRITKAQQAARAALVEAQAAYARTPVPKRGVSPLTPSARAAFAYTGEPIYKRGYASRPPMKYAAGKRAHLLALALRREAAATAKYLSGTYTPDFAARMANVPHVGRALPHTEAPPTPGSLVRHRVVEPSTGRKFAYNEKPPDSTGLPAARDYESELNWTPSGEAFWREMDAIADAHQDLPRARATNEYLNSLLAWSDPAAKPEDVDLIRLQDMVYVTDKDIAKRVGDIEQPLPGVAANGKTLKPAAVTSDGFTARVVGFRVAADGTPVPIVQPHALIGSTWTPKGDPIEVPPRVLTYMERGRVGRVADEVTGKGRITTPMTDAEWAEVRAAEDAIAGARTARYADKERFVKLAPPERPTETNYNFNPDAARNYFTDADREAIRAEMGVDGIVGARQKTGVEGEIQVRAAEDAVAKRQGVIDELRDQLRAMLAEPAQRASLEQALSAASAEYGDLARRIYARDMAPEDVEILPARAGLEDLNTDIESISRTLERANRRFIEDRARSFVERLRDLGGSANDAVMSGLKPVVQDIIRAFNGDVGEGGEKLAKAFQSIDPDATTPNARAWEVATDNAEAFRESVLEGAVQPETVTSVAAAYVRNSFDLSPDQRRLLATVVGEWARDGAPLDALREKLRAVTAGFDYEMRFAQEGDAHLAHALLVEGAWRRAVDKARARGVAMSARDAAAVNSYMHGISGRRGQGGRSAASRGRSLFARLLVPEDHRPPVKSLTDLTGTDVSRDMRTPMVAAADERGPRTPGVKAPKSGNETVEAASRQDVVAGVEEVLEQAERAYAESVYVPRALREALNTQLDAVIATARIGRQSGIDLVAVDFWKQANVLGTLFAKPQQTWMDFVGDTIAAMSDPTIGPVAAARMAARSLFAQFAGTRGAAQITRFVDWLRKMQDPSVEAGQTARDIVARMSWTPEIDAITRGDSTMPVGNYTARDLHKTWRDAGVFESFSSGQFSRSVEMMAARIHRNRPLERAWMVYQDNASALQDMANIAATRRRVALAYTLLEAGMSPEDAGRAVVRALGNFAGELHPVERNTIAVLFPFYPYRKFNARRVMKMLLSPFWLTRVQKGQEGGSAMLSWAMDSSDEYGFHTDAMSEEYDPEEMQRLRDEARRDNPNLEGAELEEEAILRAEEQGDVPKARARYDRMVARLRAIEKAQGRQAALAAAQLDPDAKALISYYAPDPAREMLPVWAQDRYALWLQENRSQALDPWFREGVGRSEMRGDQQRAYLFPADPNSAGLADVLTIAAVPVALARSLASGDGRPGGLGGGTALDGFVRTPIVQTLLGAGTSVDLQDYAMPKKVPDALGPLFEHAGLAVPRTVRARGQDIRAGQEGKTKTQWEMPADVLNTLYLVPLLSVPILSAVDATEVVEGLSGTARDAGPADTADRAFAVGNALFGQKLTTMTPSASARYAKQDADARVKRLAEAMATPTPPAIGDERMLRRALSTQRQSTTSDQEKRAAVANLLAQRKPRVTDYIPLRNFLLDNGVLEERVLRLTDVEVEERVREVVAGKEVTR